MRRVALGRQVWVDRQGNQRRSLGQRVVHHHDELLHRRRRFRRLERQDPVRRRSTPSPEPLRRLRPHRRVALVPDELPAVGSDAIPLDSFSTLQQGCNGKTWSDDAAAHPNVRLGELDGVPCTSATDCIALDDWQPLLGAANGYLGPAKTWIERWDGTTWSIVRTRMSADGPTTARAGLQPSVADPGYYPTCESGMLAVRHIADTQMLHSRSWCENPFVGAENGQRALRRVRESPSAPQNIFTGRVAESYDASSLDMYEPAVLDPTVRFSPRLSIAARRRSSVSGPEGSRCR